MDKTDVASFSMLPYCNSKFKSFFDGKSKLTKDLKYAFEYVRDMNSIRKNEMYPHTMVHGEDSIEVFSQDNEMHFYCQFDNKGVGKNVICSINDREHKIDLKSYTFGIHDDTEDDTFTVSYRKINSYKDGSTKTTLGVQTYNAEGLQTGLKSVVKQDSKGNTEQISSTFEFVDGEGRLCTERLSMQNPPEFQAEASDVLAFRLEMLDHQPTANYAVDGNRAKCDDIIKIMTVAEQVISSQVSEEAASAPEA